MFSAMLISLFFNKFTARTVVMISAAIVIAASVRTYERGKDWDNDMSLMTAGVRSSPNSVKSWNNFAVQLGEYAEMENDPSEKINKYREAVLACDRAIEIYPYNKAFLNRALYNIKLGNFDSAEKDLRKLISLGILHPEVQNKLGAILANRGKSAEALELWRISLRLDGNQEMLKRAIDDLQNEMNMEEKKNDIQR